MAVNGGGVMSRRIAVIGGGAAGMAAAIRAAQCGAHVTVYERNDRIGKKILSTGNGKCNFSNEKMSAAYYYGSGSRLIEPVYGRIGVREVRELFEGLGMRIKDKNGYLYPASEQASTVLDVLRYEMERLKVEVHTGQLVTDLKVHKGMLSVETADRSKSVYDAVILACGGRAAPKTGSDGMGFKLAAKMGHRIVPTVPALTALRCEGDFWKRVAGVRCEAGLTLKADGKKVCAERGELQWTDYGISGIPVFQMSRHAAYGLEAHKAVTVEINLMPDDREDRDGYEAFWIKRWARQDGQTMEQFVTGLVNKKIGLMLLKQAQIKESEKVQNVSAAYRKRLSELFCSFTVTVKGTNPFEQAQVCAGGVDCSEVTEDLASVIVPGLFFAGEILDVDGMCGGYNLQWAWSSGMTAGQAAAGRL